MRAPLAGRLVLVSPFGPRGEVRDSDGRLVDEAGHHNGADYRAAIGTPVLAPAAGIITKQNVTSRGARQLFLQTATHRFAFVHLNEELVGVGDIVGEGEVIALSGNTGGVDAHLHVEARDLTGQLIDPHALFTGGGGRSNVLLLAFVAFAASRLL